MLPSAHTHRDRTFEGLAVHDHVCAIGESLQQQLDTAAAFLRIGLARGDRCIYITHENPPAAILQALRAAQVEVEPPLKSGALQVVTKSETYIKPGHFDPDWMLDYLAQACAASRRAGFPVTRVAGEASWILDGDRGAERFMEYEARVDALMRDFDLITLCQYNVTRFDAQTLLHAIGTHPLIVVGDICTPNPYYLPNNPTDGTSDGSLHLRRVLRAVQQCGRLEQEVRNNERLLRQFINASPDWALLLDLEGRVISCNEAMARRMHRPVEEILNRQFGEILDAQTAQVSGAYYERAIATASPYHWTDQRLGRRYDHYATPILDGNGQVRLVALFVHDITEHELTQERNQALSEQLRQAQKMQAVGQLAGRTILTTCCWPSPGTPNSWPTC